MLFIDVDGIQSYIFSTNKLKTIMGASWILDDINVVRTKEMFPPGGPAGVIYSGGGNTLIRYSGDEPSAELSELLRLYREHGMSVTWACAPFDPSDYQRSMRDVRRRLARAKVNKRNTLASAASPYFKLCELCGREYAEGSCDGSVACRTCLHKYRSADRPLRGLESFRFFSNFGAVDQMVAVVVMDGNGMSGKIDRLQSLEELADFSASTESIIRKAFLEGVEARFPGEIESGSIIPIRPLIMGGDDICFITLAHHAFPFVEGLIRAVEEKSSQFPRLFRNRITLSAGILFMKSSYPFNFAHRIAESLLRSAKKASRDREQASMVDFHVLLSSSGDVIDQTRAREYEVRDGHDLCRLTRRPYSREGLVDLMEDAGLLGKCLAGNKLKGLRPILRRGRSESLLELNKMAARMTVERRDAFFALTGRHGWRWEGARWCNSLLDLVEVSGLCAGKAGKKEAGDGAH